MSSLQIARDDAPETGNRRSVPREKVGGFALVFFEGDHWGKLVNISSGGMAFEFTHPPIAERSTNYTIEVLGADGASQDRSIVQTAGRLVWTNEQSKTAGVQFIDLAGNAQEQIKHWLSMVSSPAHEDAPDVQEMLTSIKTHLRELLSAPVEADEEVSGSDYRQYLDDSFSRLEKMDPSELLGREVSSDTETQTAASSGSISDPAVVELLTKICNGTAAAAPAIVDDAAAPDATLDATPQANHDAALDVAADAEHDAARAVLLSWRAPSSIETIQDSVIENTDREKAEEAPLEIINDAVALEQLTEAAPVGTSAPEPVIADAPAEMATASATSEEVVATSQASDNHTEDSTPQLSRLDEILGFELVEAETPEAHPVVPADSELEFDADPAPITPIADAHAVEPAAARLDHVSSFDELNRSADINADNHPPDISHPAINLDALIQEMRDAQPHAAEISASAKQPAESTESFETPGLEARLPVEPEVESAKLEAPPEPSSGTAVVLLSEPATLEVHQPNVSPANQMRLESGAEAALDKPLTEVPRTEPSIPEAAGQPAKAENAANADRVTNATRATSEKQSRIEHRAAPSVSRPRGADQSIAQTQTENFTVATSGSLKSRSEESTERALPNYPKNDRRQERVALFSVIGCFIVLVALALTITLSPANRLAAAALLENVRKPFISKPSPVAVVPAAAVSPFQVEVVNLHNRRWLLNFESPANPAKPISAPAPGKDAKNPAPVPALTHAPKSVVQSNESKGAAGSPGPSTQDSQRTPSSVDSRGAAGSTVIEKVPEAMPSPVSDLPQIVTGIPAPARATLQPAAEPASTSSQPSSQPALQPFAQPDSRVDNATSPSPSVKSSEGSDLVKPAILFSSVPPVYSTDARSRRIEGDVIVDATIDETGRVEKMKVVSGHSSLRPAALEALRQWKYEPAHLRGQAVATEVRVTIRFHLK